MVVGGGVPAPPPVRVKTGRQGGLTLFDEEMIRLTTLLLTIAGCSCDTKNASMPTDRLRTFATADDPSGSDRVRLVYITRSALCEDSDGFDFDSIIWEKHSGGRWAEHLRITDSQFQADSDHERWPADLHSFDAHSGSVIARIAEGDAPRGSGTINYNYSWRRWDLNSNSESRYLYGLTQEELFDAYDPNRSEQGGGGQPAIRPESK